MVAGRACWEDVVPSGEAVEAVVGATTLPFISIPNPVCGWAEAPSLWYCDDSCTPGAAADRKWAWWCCTIWFRGGMRVADSAPPREYAAMDGACAEVISGVERGLGLLLSEPLRLRPCCPAPPGRNKGELDFCFERFICRQRSGLSL